MAAILVLNVKVPFTEGGQDLLVRTLTKELRARGHEADIIELPFSPSPKEAILSQMGMWRALELSQFGGRKVDLVIATKFPSYYSKHHRKSLWLVHQHRAVYELYGGRYSDISDDPRDEQLREVIVNGDNHVLSEFTYRSGISKNVVERLSKYNGLSAEVLYPPLPLGNRYYSAAASPYILYVGRICRIKRIDQLITAMPQVTPGINFKIVGVPDEPDVMKYLQSLIDAHQLHGRIEFLGRVDDATLLKLYAEALGVFYAPFNEDYGYVTLEAMASGKPVITSNDSGGPLEFVQDGVNGLITEPHSSSTAEAVNRLANDRDFARRLGVSGRSLIESSEMLEAGWERVVEKLLSPLKADRA